MKLTKTVALSLALLATAASANHYGSNFYEVATAPRTEVNVLAQADSAEALQQQLASKGQSALDVNELMAQSPTAAGTEADGPRIIETQVVDWCGHAYYGVSGCKMKTVVQLVE